MRTQLCILPITFGRMPQNIALRHALHSWMWHKLGSIVRSESHAVPCDVLKRKAGMQVLLDDVEYS